MLGRVSVASSVRAESRSGTPHGGQGREGCKNQRIPAPAPEWPNMSERQEARGHCQTLEPTTLGIAGEKSGQGS